MLIIRYTVEYSRYYFLDTQWSTPDVNSGVNNMPSNAWQDPNAHQDRSAALLFAHRCYMKDVPIPIPVPLNTIPDIIVPSHVVVQRCKGKE